MYWSIAFRLGDYTILGTTRAKALRIFDMMAGAKFVPQIILFHL